jgi:hypothetical protein
MYSFVSNEAYSISKKKKAFHYLPATVLQRKDACKLNWKKVEEEVEAAAVTIVSSANSQSQLP